LPSHKINNIPFDDEEAVEVKDISSMKGIKCCFCIPLNAGLISMIFIAIVDFLFTLGNMLFGLLFYVVGKSA
jgi:hypothetical protein